MASIIIKKYNNRRLYNTKTKSYITLEDIAQLIRQGNEVKIIDNDSKEDITQETLLQIILQGDKEAKNLFSSSLLHKLICLQKEQYQEFFQHYLTASLDYFVKLKQSMMQPFSMFPWLNPGGFPNPMDAQKEMWENMEKKFAEYEKKIQDLEKQVEKKEK